MRNSLCLGGMFVIWTSIFCVGLAALLRMFDLPWSLGLTAALAPSAGLSLGLVSLLSKLLNFCEGPDRREPSFREDAR